MRETESVIHGNKTRDNNNPLISAPLGEGLTKKRFRPVASGCRKSCLAVEIGNVVYSGITVIGGRVAESGDIVLP